MRCCRMSAGRLVYTYEMVKQFLQEEGYGDVPIPATADELKLFRRPRQSQLQLFAERGYIHNPIKILFSRTSNKVWGKGKEKNHFVSSGRRTP